jgi:hypothetical protein
LFYRGESKSAPGTLPTAANGHTFLYQTRIHYPRILPMACWAFHRSFLAKVNEGGTLYYTTSHTPAKAGLVHTNHMHFWGKIIEI